MTKVSARRLRIPRLSRFGWLMALYAENHQRLMRLFEPADLPPGIYVSSVGDGLDVRLEVIAQHAYTAEIRMTYTMQDPITGEPDPSAFLRLYRDARQVEATHCYVGRRWQDVIGMYPPPAEVLDHLRRTVLLEEGSDGEGGEGGGRGGGGGGGDDGEARSSAGRKLRQQDLYAAAAMEGGASGGPVRLWEVAGPVGDDPDAAHGGRHRVAEGPGQVAVEEELVDQADRSRGEEARQHRLLRRLDVQLDDHVVVRCSTLAQEAGNVHRRPCGSGGHLHSIFHDELAPPGDGGVLGPHGGVDELHSCTAHLYLLFATCANGVPPARLNNWKYTTSLTSGSVRADVYAS